MDLVNLISGQYSYRKAGNKHGGEFHGPCPFCGDGGKGPRSDRFHIWPGQGSTGRYWCRICGQHGDAIQYLRETENLNYGEACQRLGIVMAELPKKQLPRPSGFVPESSLQPQKIWLERAAAFTDFCHTRLLETPAQLSWLEGRGICRQMVEKYRLGWNPSHVWRPRTSWGLQQELKPNGQQKMLWLPKGLLIPVLVGGAPVQLRIRQPEGGPRYYVVPGSSRKDPLLTREADAMVIVESGLDAILLDAVAGDLVGVAALGNASIKPTPELHAIMEKAEHISVSLDSDTPRRNEVTGRWEIPGGMASRWWLEQYSAAERVPVVGGKDPGDAYKEGVDLRSWVVAGLPPYFRVKAQMADKQVAAAAVQRVEQERVDVHNDAACGQQVERVITLNDGRSFLVTDNKGEWMEAVDAGRLVFSGGELLRLRRVVAGMDDEERHLATSLVLDIKELFPGAYIRDGRSAL